MPVTTVMKTKKAGFIATGNEITCGDLVNTNSTAMAHRLEQAGIRAGSHLMVADCVHHIDQALHFLLRDHDAIIITGGLGPTSDDLTRQAIAHALDLPLFFHQPSWDKINQTFSQKNIPLTDNNRQQALFPKGAQVIDNSVGTANGCIIEKDHRLIFMLPGPPKECLPMFEQSILPTLKSRQFSHQMKRYNWRLLGVSESAIAQELDQLGQLYDVEFGYRVFYPYLDIKCQLLQNQVNPRLFEHIDTIIKPYLISTHQSSASEQLIKTIANIKQPLYIGDQATRGALAAAINLPSNQHLLEVGQTPNHSTATHTIYIKGLQEYWQTNKRHQATHINIILNLNDSKETIAKTIPLRGDKTIFYAVELICHVIRRKMMDFGLCHSHSRLQQ